jgi:hypothetical protein
MTIDRTTFESIYAGQPRRESATANPVGCLEARDPGGCEEPLDSEGVK